MISAVRTCDHRRGFTLIEIVMVLAIATMLLGGAVAFMVFRTDERALRNASGEFRLLAKRARTITTRRQTPYAPEFRPGSSRCLPIAEAGQDESKTALGHTIGGEKVAAAGTVHDAVSLEGGMVCFIRRWNTVDWLPMSDRIVHVWRFDPDGLCEPVGVRLSIGSNYIETTYHPLTATVCDTALEVK